MDQRNIYIAFLQLEREAINADELMNEQVTALLDKLAKFFQTEELRERHLRIASSTVHIVNRIEDAEQREKYFGQFGTLFSKSSDKQLARYGKKIAKTKPSVSSDLIGKPLELTGQQKPQRHPDAHRDEGKQVLRAGPQVAAAL